MSLKPLEREIQGTVTQFLELDGWRSLRTDPVSDRSRGKGFGEVGMADMLYIRYGAYDWIRADTVPPNIGFYEQHAKAQVLWIEFKRERGGSGKRGLFTKAEKAKIHQRQWIEAERARGALVLLVGEDCPATIEGILGWYKSSGLQRKTLTMGVSR